MLNLNKELNKFNSSARRKSSPSGIKKSKRKALIILVLLLIFLIIPLISIFFSVRKVSQSAKVMVAGFKQENLNQIKPGLKETKGAVDNLNFSLNLLIWLRVIPFVGGYYGDIQHFVGAASAELEAAEIMTTLLDPYKGELGLAGGVTPGQDKIAQAVKILDKILPEIDKIEPQLKKARQEVEGIDTKKYPEVLKDIRVRSKLDTAKNFIIGADIAVSENKEALKIAPDALGQNSPKNYLLLFQNDKEIRATGGFMTAYAFLRLDKGHISTTTSDDIYRLDEKLLNVCKSKICPLTPPTPIVKYLPEADGKTRTAWSMRDSNISPDFPTSMKQFESMYEYLGEGISFDGIIAIDTEVVKDLISITGPIDVFGTTYSAEDDKRCNCSNVIYELEHYAEIASKGEEDRKAILGTLMQQILARSLGSVMDKLPEFINTGVLLANDKHILFYNHDPKTQAALANLGWTGEIKPFEGDYLHINDSNFAGGKSNLYVEEKVTLDIKVDSSGNVKNKVTIDYKNPQPFNTWLNGILRDYVRVYIPRGAKLTASKGSADPVNTLEDTTLNKTYFDAFIQVRPQNSITLSFEYTLPNRVQTKQYPLLIQKQPGAKDFHYVVKINGSTKAEFDLTSDKLLNLSF